MNLNETILRNLHAEHDLSCAAGKVLRTAYLAAEIAKLEKIVEADRKLREEFGLPV